MKFNDVIRKKVDELLAEGVGKDQAVAIAYKYAMMDGDSVAVITSEGKYPYVEVVDGKPTINVKTKEAAEIKRLLAAIDGHFFPLYPDHSESELIGVAYDFKEVTLPGGNIGLEAKLYSEGEPLAEGAGVSIGYTSMDVACEQGTCQRDITLRHVAASNEMVPRGSNNVIRQADGASNMTGEEKDVPKENSEVEQLKARIKELEAQLNEYKSKEKDALLDSVKGLLKEKKVGKIDGIDEMCTRELEIVKATLDSVAFRQPFFDTVEEHDGLFKPLESVI